MLGHPVTCGLCDLGPGKTPIWASLSIPEAQGLVTATCWQDERRAGGSLAPARPPPESEPWGSADRGYLQAALHHTQTATELPRTPNTPRQPRGHPTQPPHPGLRLTPTTPGKTQGAQDRLRARRCGPHAASVTACHSAGWDRRLRDGKSGRATCPSSQREVWLRSWQVG